MNSEPPRQNFPFSPESVGSPNFMAPIEPRIGLVVFAGVLALGGLWLLLSSLLLPQAIALPLDRSGAAAAATHREGALWAARLGLIRGDLFAQAAFTDADLVWPDRTRSPDAATAARLQHARSYVQTALALAPVNSAAWLFLAELPAAASKTTDADAMIPLQMSYFTAPNDPALAGARVERALALSAPIDKDLQEFIKGDVRQILTNRPEQKPAIVAAYKAATPQNQSIFEAIAASADPDFSQSLRGEAAK